MKLISIFLFTIFAFFSAQAQLVVEDVVTSTFIQSDCLMCDGGTEVTQTTITFTDEWCAPISADAYEIKIEDRMTMGRRSYKAVQVQLKKVFGDCMGPTHVQTFHLTTDEIKKGDRYILMNASAIK